MLHGTHVFCWLIQDLKKKVLFFPCHVDRDLVIRCNQTVILQVGAYAAATTNGSWFHTTAATGASCGNQVVSGTASCAAEERPIDLQCVGNDVSNSSLLDMAPAVVQAINSCTNPGSSISVCALLGMTARLETAGTGCLFAASTNVTMTGGFSCG